MAIMMIVSLFTSRITLRALGVEDYGIYNVVGGIVIFLEAVLISFDKFVKHDLDECNLYHSFRSFSKEFVIDGQPSEVFQP